MLHRCTVLCSFLYELKTVLDWAWSLTPSVLQTGSLKTSAVHPPHNRQCDLKMRAMWASIGAPQPFVIV
jgi:hypothetical protein